MKTKQTQINQELEMIKDAINTAYTQGIDFDELTSMFNIEKFTLRNRLKQLDYDWVELKHKLDENSIQHYFRLLDEEFPPFPKTFAEDIFAILGETELTKRYCKERNIKSNKYRYVFNGENISKSNHPLFVIWNTMKSRTGHGTNGYILPHHEKYYLSKGIDMCDEWLDFDTFYDYMIDLGWYKGCHISRIGDTGNYEPNNVIILDARTNIKDAHPTCPIKITNKVTGEEFYFESQNDAAKELKLNQGSLSLKLRGIANCYDEYLVEFIQ